MCTLTVSKETCSISRNDANKSSFCFVQYTAVVSLKREIDMESGCIKLRRSRGTKENRSYTKWKNGLNPGERFGMAPTRSVLKIVSIVSAKGEETCSARTLVDRSLLSHAETH